MPSFNHHTLTLYSHLTFTNISMPHQSPSDACPLFLIASPSIDGLQRDLLLPRGPPPSLIALELRLDRGSTTKMVLPYENERRCADDREISEGSCTG
jgi:hypothetical protein